MGMGVGASWAAMQHPRHVPAEKTGEVALAMPSRRERKASVYWRRRQNEKRLRETLRHRPREATEDVCPISFRTAGEMEHPVVTSDGFVYEAAYLARWLAQSSTSPITREELLLGIPLSVAKRAVQRAERRAAVATQERRQVESR